MTIENQLTQGQARVIDPILTTAARGYMSRKHIWPMIFPPVTVAARGGTLITFGAEHFAQMDIIRAPGAHVPRINIGHEGDTFSTVQRALAGAVPLELMEDAMAVPGISMASGAVMATMEIVSLQIEIEAASKIVAGNFPGRTMAVAGNNQWDNPNSNPAKTVNDKRKEIRKGIGMNPNTLIVGEEVHDQLRENPDVIERIKHVMPGFGGAVTEEMLRQYFDVEHYGVGIAMKGLPGAFEQIWEKIALLCYTGIGSLAQRGAPSFGYTYRLGGYPMAEAGWYDKNTRSWVYPVTTEDTPEIVGAEAGYLWTEVIS